MKKATVEAKRPRWLGSDLIPQGKSSSHRSIGSFMTAAYGLLVFEADPSSKIVKTDAPKLPKLLAQEPSYPAMIQSGYLDDAERLLPFFPWCSRAREQMPFLPFLLWTQLRASTIIPSCPAPQLFSNHTRSMLYLTPFIAPYQFYAFVHSLDGVMILGLIVSLVAFNSSFIALCH